MSQFADAQGFLRTLGEGETITVNALADRLRTDSRFARIALIDAP